MPVNLGLTQRTQIKKETTAGTAVTPDKTLRSVTFDRQPQVTTKQFTAGGYKNITSSRQSRRYDTWKVGGVPSFEELPFLYSCILKGGITPTTPDGGTLSKQWVFQPSLTDPDPLDTYTIQQGNSVRARKAAYMFINSLTQTITSDDTSLDGTATSQKAARGATMNASATELPTAPITGDMYSVYIDSTFANLGTTQIHDAYSITSGTEDKQELRFPVDRSLNGGYAGPAEVAAKWSLKVKIEDNTVADILEDALENGTPVYVRIEAVGDVIETTEEDVDITYLHQLDVACTVMNIGNPETDMGVYMHEYELTPWADPTAGYAIKATIICTAASF